MSIFTDLDAETLHVINTLLKREFVFPTVKEVAKHLHTPEDTTRKRMKRLEKLKGGYSYIVAVDKKTKKLHDNLCDEPASARILLNAHELAKAAVKTNYIITKDKIVNTVKDDPKNELGEDEIRTILEKMIESEYLTQVLGRDNALRIGPRLKMELKYLQLTCRYT